MRRPVVISVILVIVLTSKTSSKGENEPTTGWVTSVSDSAAALSGIVRTPDAGFLAAGSLVPPNVYNSDGWVVKFSKDGAVLWQKRIGTLPSDDVYRHVSATSDGGFLLCGGSTPKGDEVEDGWVTKLRGTGTVAWSKRYRDNWLESFFAGFERPDHRYILLGYEFDYYGYTDGQDPWLVCLDKNGKILWQKRYPGDEQYDGAEMYAVTPTSDGGCLLAGSTGEYNSADGVALRIDGTGGILWQVRFPGKSNDQIEAAIGTSDGFLLVGSTKSFGAKFDVWAIRLGTEGNIIWQYRYKGTADCLAHSVVQTTDGGFIIAATGMKDSELDLRLMRITATGGLVWGKSYKNVLAGITSYNSVKLIPNADMYAIVASAYYGHRYGIGAFVGVMDGNGVFGNCRSIPWRLTPTKTTVKLTTPSYAAVATTAVINTSTKDISTVVSEESFGVCK